jgi:DNA-binding LytR/AlgR family response regulator
MIRRYTVSKNDSRCRVRIHTLVNEVPHFLVEKHNIKLAGELSKKILETPFIFWTTHTGLHFETFGTDGRYQ